MAKSPDIYAVPRAQRAAETPPASGGRLRKAILRHNASTPIGVAMSSPDFPRTGPHRIDSQGAWSRGSFSRSVAGVLACLLLVACSVRPLAAQSEPPAAQAQADLSNVQKQIFRDYERFEKSLYDVAEQIRLKDPEQSEVLYRARSKSQEASVLADMELIAELLRASTSQQEAKSAQYGPAVDRQQELLVRMESILKLLQSLDDRQRLAEEMQRIQELLKETNRLIAGQKDVRAETLRGREAERLKDSQQKVADKARELAEKIERQDQLRNQNQQGEENSTDGQSGEDAQQKSADGQSSEMNGDSTPDGKSPDGKSEDSQTPSGGEKPSEQQPGDSPSPAGEPGEKSKEMPAGEQSPTPGGEQKPGESQQSDQKSGDQKSGEQQPGEQQSGQQQSGESQQGEQQQGEDQQQSQQQSPQQQQQTPGREQLEQARQQMQKAIEDLQKEQREQAVQDQDAAVARLEELKAELEEILRQLREEEKESYLTLLEARFQNMLRRQLQINSETVRLYEIPEEARLQQNFASKTNEIRKDQEDNAIDAGKALNLLREEGSSVAFPEAVEQMQKNMLVIVERLARQDTGKTTQLVETLVVETLEEMIDAFQKELKKQEEQQQDGQQNQQGAPQDPALVDQIAELKMIRSLQMQINRITQQLGTEIEDPSQIDVDQQSLIDDIAQRQKRVQEATYDLSVGRNK